MGNNLNMSKDIIGRAERVAFPSLGLVGVPAKIDTGADSSSIWCSHIKLVNGRLECIFFGPVSSFFNGQTHIFKKSEFDVTRIANSFGVKEMRFKVKLPINIHGRTINASFTLADRSTKLYPVLIGVATLKGKFLVDPAIGRPLEKEEQNRKERLLKQMAKHKKEIGL